MVFAHGKSQRRKVLELAMHKFRVLRDEAFDRFQIPCDSGADHRPDIDATAARPGLKFFALQRLRLDHSRDFGFWITHTARLDNEKSANSITPALSNRPRFRKQV